MLWHCLDVFIITGGRKTYFDPITREKKEMFSVFFMDDISADDSRQDLDGVLSIVASLCVRVTTELTNVKKTLLNFR